MALTDRRYFLSLTEAQLVTALADVEQEIAGGQTLDSWDAGDTSAHHVIDRNLSATKRREMILHDLGILNPAGYPPRTYAPVKRTVPRYL